MPVLLTNAPMPPVTSMTSRKSTVSFLPASFRIFELIIFARPVWKMAPPTTKRPIIMMTTWFENPDNASSGVSIWNMSSASRAQSATMSERNFPETKNAAETASMSMVINMGRRNSVINTKILFFQDTDFRFFR